MATTLKRILAVVALIAVVFTVGFLVFTETGSAAIRTQEKTLKTRRIYPTTGTG